MTELLELTVASLILAIGLIAFALAALRWPARDWATVWFGLFACLYAVRLAGDSGVVQPFLPEVFWRYLGAFITYGILVPGALFVESLFGPGWWRSLLRVRQAYSVYAPLAIGYDIVLQEPGAALWLNPFAVFIAGSVTLCHVLANWGRTSWSRELRVAAVGGLVFLAVAAYQTFGGTIQLEHFAMLLFVACVGYFVLRRVLIQETQLVGMFRELDIAREIQQSILPISLPTLKGMQVAARYLPMNNIGGDFYDFDVQANRLGVVIADVSGHGVPAALVASMVKIAFAAETGRLESPGQALTNMNRTLSGRFAGAYVTACCCSLDALNGRLRFASAGHPAPLLRRKDGSTQQLDECGLLLAFDPNAQYATAEVNLAVGDRLVLFSDGVVEASNARDEFFGVERLALLLATSAATTPDYFVDQIVAELQRWVGADNHFQDDVTLVVIDLDELGAYQT